jgi:protein SCO1
MIRRSMAAAALVLLIGSGNFALTFAGPAPAPGPSSQRPTGDTYAGGLVTPALPKPRFTLTDTSGTPFDFWAKTQGYVTLLFFGYTQCPDECPLHMANVAMALKKLPAAVQEQVRLVFVTTDPGHDNRQALRTWLGHFDVRFVGLTGSDAAIDAAQRAAGLPVAKKAPRAGQTYAVSHANVVLAYSKDNLAHLMYPGGITQQDWVRDLPRLVKETW